MINQVAYTVLTNIMKIAFGYKQGVGKDTAVDYLHNKHGGDHLSFAFPIYDILTYTQCIYKFPHQKDRKFLQFIGEWARNINQDTWVNILKEKDINLPYRHRWISDLRYLNEFYALKKEGWVCVRIDKELDKVGREIRMGSGSASHQSEVELTDSDLPWDYVIQNNSSIQKFYESLDDLVNKINHTR